MMLPGTAMNTPSSPASCPPISSAMITVIGLSPVARAMMRGTSRWFSSCWIAMYMSPTHRPLIGSSAAATITAGIAPRIGPTIGISSVIPASTASTSANFTPSTSNPK